MTDPTLIVPYHDPYDENEQLINMVDFYNPYIDDLLSVIEPSSLFPSPTTTYITNLIADNNDSFSKPWDNLHNQDTNYGVMSQIDHNNIGTSNSGYVLPQSENDDVVGGNLGAGNDVWPISVWRLQPADSIWCNSCTVLREIIHTNGHQTTKLDIHGRIGMICHAILETEEDAFSEKSRQMIDFSMKSIENVKEFLVQYCQERKQSGFMMMPGDLSIFYDALYAVGLNSDDWTIDDLLEYDLEDQINHKPEYETVLNQNYQSSNGNVSDRNATNRKRTRRPSLSEQRQRIASMSLNDITALFHLPIDEAAKQMALCSTVVKKICRRDGLVRWPHRKVKSLQKKIEKLRPVLNSFNEEDRASAQAQIQEFEQQLQEIFNGAYTSLRGGQ